MENEIKKTNKKNIVKVKETPDNPMALLAMAVQQDVDVIKLEKLMDLQERWESGKAKKAFNEAMAEFQGECPVITKDRDGGSTNTGRIAYRYAPLDSIVTQTKELIQKHGFSYLIKASTLEKGVTATCIVKHKLGHTEESSISVPLGTKTNVMSDSQVVMAAMTFAKRYAFCNAFGIITGEDDNEKKLAGKGPKKTDVQVQTVRPSIDETIAGIRTSKDRGALAKAKASIMGSKNYSEVEKSRIIDVIDSRIEDLNG